MEKRVANNIYMCFCIKDSRWQPLPVYSLDFPIVLLIGHVLCNHTSHRNKIKDCLYLKNKILVAPTLIKNSL
jgi:hypothetical protein